MDKRQTDGRPMTCSEHELKFMFAKNIIKYCQTSKIAVMFIHKTCNLQLEMCDYGVI